MKQTLKKVNMLLLIIMTLTYYVMPFASIGSKTYASENMIEVHEESTKEDGKGVSNDYFEVRSILDNTSRYKGILLANLVLEEKNEFKIKDSLSLKIKEKADFSNFEISNDVLIQKNDGEEVDVSDYMIYKALIIDKESFDKVFGKSGKMVLLDSLGEEIATVDNTITPIENEYKLNFIKGIKNIRIVLYGIENVGELKFEFEMAMKNLPFVREDIENFSKIKIKNVIDTVVASEEMSEENAITTIVQTKTRETEFNSSIEIEDIFEEDTKNDTNIEIKTETVNKVESKNQNNMAKNSNTVKTENSNTIQKEEIEIVPTEENIKEIDEEKEDKKAEIVIEDIETTKDDLEKAETVKEEKQEKQENKKSYKNVKEELVNEITLENTKTQIDVSISDELLSTEKENDVTFTISLKNDGEQYDLIQNPVIRMNLPDDIDLVEISDVSLINKNGLTLDSWGYNIDLTGKKYIELALSGTEDLYNVSTISETTITLETKITLNRLTTSKDSQIEIMYTNDLMTNLDYAPQSSFKSLPIKYVGREDLLRFYTLENYNDKNEKIEMFNEIRSIGNVEVAQSARDAKVNLSIVNNYGKDLEKVRIIGKLPVTSNVDTKGYNLDNSFDMNLKGELMLHGLSAKVYYTDKENVSESSNDWKENIEEVSNVKAFKIVIDSDKMSQGEQLNISYDLSMPGNIDYNDKSYQDITVYYELNGATIIDTSIIGLAAPEKEELSLDLISPEKKTVVSMTSDIITQEQVIDEIIGDIDQNIANIEDIQNIEKIDATQVPKGLDEVSDDETEEPIVSNDIDEIKNEIEENHDKPVAEDVGSPSEGTFEVESGVYIDDEKVGETADVRERQILKYVYVLKNNSDKALTNVKVDATVTNANMFYLFSKELMNESDGELSEATRLEEDKDGNHKVEKFTFDKILPGEVKEISFMAVVKPYIELQEKEVSAQIHITSREIEDLKIESQKNKVVQGKVETFIRRSSFEDVRYTTLYPGDTARYEIYVKNISSDDLDNVFVNLNLKGYVIASSSVFREYPNSTRDYISDGEIVTFSIDRIKSGEEVSIYLDLITTTIPTNKDKGSFSAVVKVNVDKEEYISNKYSREVIQNALKFNTILASNKSITEKVWDGEKVTFTYSVKNESAIDADFSLFIFNGYGFVTDSVKVSEPSKEIYNKEVSMTDDMSENLILAPGDEMIFTIEVHFELSKAANGQKYVSSSYHLSNDERDIKTLRYEIGWPEENSKIEVEEPTEKPVEEEVTETNIVNEDEIVIVNTDEYIDPDAEENDENVEYKEVQNNVVVYDEESIESTPVSDVIQNEEIKTENVVNEVIKVDNSKATTTTTAESNANQNKVQEEKISSTGNTRNDSISQNSSIKKQVTTAKNNNGIFEYTISGRMWIDFDDNGMFDEDVEDKTAENVVKNLYLYKVNGNQVDLSKPVRKISKVGNEKYRFAELGQGEYIVLAEYDSDNYKLAKYTSDDSTQIVASQGIEKTINNVNYATSNKIEISEGNVSNVNIGFTPKNKFDMKVETYLEEVSLKNSKDSSKVYFEDENSLQKVEIRSKYINDTTITAKYTIKITNEGNIPGYVTQIEDVIPAGWTFSEKANKNWKQGTDGKVYNSSLKGSEIKSGTVRYLTINLTLKTNEENTGIHTNQVSIVEATNSKQIADENLPNNNAKVDLMVLISTGRVVSIIIIVIIFILSLIAICIYIRFFRNKNKTVKSMAMMILVAALLIQINIIKSYAASYLMYGVSYNSPVSGYKERMGAFASGRKASNENALTYTSLYDRLLYSGSFNNKNSNYHKKSSFMANLYLREKSTDAYRRKRFLESRQWRGHPTKNDYTDFFRTDQATIHAVRTQFCLHSSDVDDDNGLVDNILSAICIIDYGWNNYPVQHFVRSYGVAANNYETGLDDGSLYMSRYHCNQQMAYLLYRAEIGAAATKRGVSMNSTAYRTWDNNKYAKDAYPKGSAYYPLNGQYQVFSNYKKGPSFLLYTSGLKGHHYNSTMLDDIWIVGDVSISVNRGNALSFADDNEKDLTDAGVSFKNFTFSAAQLRVNEEGITGYNLNDSDDEDSILTDMGSNDYFRVRSANGDTTNITYAGKDYTLTKLSTSDEATFKTTTSVQTGGKMRTSVIGNTSYINNIKIKYPLEGADVYMNNHVNIQYKNTAGNWVPYNGNVYSKNATGNLVAYAQTEYGINAASRTGLYNNELFIPMPADIDKTSRGDVLKIVNTYNTYSGRLMYITSDTEGQPQGVGRGVRIVRESSVSYKFDSPDIRLTKSVERVDGGLPQFLNGFPLAEKGCSITYKITIKNMLMPVKNLKLFDIRYFGSTLPVAKVYKNADCSIESEDWHISGDEISRRNTMNGDGTTEVIYLRYIVDEPSSPTELKLLNNTIFLKYVTNVGGEVFYNDADNNGTPEVNKMMPSSVTHYTALAKERMYIVKVVKALYSVESTREGREFYDGSNSRNDTNKTTAYAESGDLVTYRIDVINSGSTDGAFGLLKNISITDTYDTKEYQFVSFRSWRVSDYTPTGTSEDWQIINNTPGSLIFKYGGASEENVSTANNIKNTGYIEPNYFCRIYLRFRVLKKSKTNIPLINTGTIVNAENHHGYSIIDYINPASVQKSRDSVTLRIYEVNTKKTIYRINKYSEALVCNDAENTNAYYADGDPDAVDQSTIRADDGNGPTLYAETGDIIQYKIQINNTGTGNLYGHLYDLVLDDIYDPNELEFLSFRSAGIDPSTGRLFDFTKGNTSGSWTRLGNEFTYNGMVAKGGAIRLYIRLKVNKMSRTNDIITNTAKVKKVKNRNNLNMIDYTNGKLKSFDIFTLRTYYAEVTKYVSKVISKYESVTYPENYKDEITTEVGDKIVYTIKVKNSGTSTDLNGKLYQVDLTDYFDTNMLRYMVVNSSNGWNYVPNTSYIFRNMSGINVGSTSTFTITCENILRSTDDIRIVNTAEIKTDNIVTNREGVNIRPVLNGTLKDDATVRYLTYHINFKKYISNGDNRDNMTNQQKYDKPVIHEKGDTVEYTLRLENVGETVIYTPTINDILESGLENINYGTNGIEGKAYILTKVNGITRRVEIASSGITVNSIDKQKMDIRLNNKANALKPGDILFIVVKADVKKTNMYLWNLQNEANITSAFNKNDVEIIAADPDIMNYDVYDNKEYVRLDDLKTSGYVWEDANNDGVMDDSESRLQNIAVNLIDVTNGKMTTVFTDINGYYSFTETNGYIYTLENGEAKRTNRLAQEKMVLSGGRVVKATNREQKYGNYYSNTLYRDYTTNSLTNRELNYPKGGTQSDYIDYYIRFDYNGSKYRSTVYASDNNLKLTDYSVKDAYHTDSNAVEYNNLRSKYKDSLEIIAYNKSMNKNKGESEDLVYSKEGHESHIIDDVTNVNSSLRMSAYSFADPTKTISSNVATEGGIDFLWLNENIAQRDNGCYVGETEYLKEISLGLKRQVVDLKLEKDLFEVRATEKGERTKYRFDQGNNASASRVDDSYRGEYVTGGIPNEKNYEFKVYRSDYEYRINQYENDNVRTCMANTELELEITYKITITNDSNLEDIPDISKDERRNVYGVVNEITDYYPVEFVKYNRDANKKKVRLYNKEPGTSGAENKMEDKDLVFTEAWYGSPNRDYVGARSLTIRPVSEYRVDNKDKEFAGYNKLYITGLQDIVLDREESEDIYIKYTVDKDADGYLKLSNGNSVAEINSYSIYEDRQKSKSLGYIDDNSNPGNVGYNKDGKYISKSGEKGVLDDKTIYDQYENDSYKTGINITVNNSINDFTSERSIRGYVWDDARTKTISSGKTMQYVGNGVHDTEEATEARRNKNLTNDKDLGGENAEKTDSFVEGVKVQLIELIEYDGKVYEEDLSKQAGASSVLTATKSDGTYIISGFTPGKYIVRFTYGHSDNNLDKKKRMRIFNGQDYKSTTYNVSLDSLEPDTYAVDSTDGDNVLAELTGIRRGLANKGKTASDTHKSDARDDEIMRLDSSSYSEYVNNEKSKILQGGVEVENNNNMTKEILDKTSVYADTPAFPVRIEDDTYIDEVRTYNFEEYNKIVTNKRYSLENIDFGIQYRPEADMDIRNYITNIKVTTESGEIVYDLNYDLYDVKGKRIHLTNDAKTKRIASTRLNEDSSKGINNQQTIRNNYDHGIKGLVYLNMDVELLVGTKINISYITNVNNISEIDRYAKNLEDIQYVSDAEASLSPSDQESFTTYIYEEQTGYNNNLQYVASGTARNMLYNDFIEGNIPTNGTSLNALSRGTRIRKSNTVMKAKNYYGKYLGNVYYTGENNLEYNDKEDVIATTKISEVLDYVDNDMTLDLSQNTESNNYLRNTSGEELVGRGMIAKYKSFDAPESWITILDNRGLSYTTKEDSRLAMVVDDRISSNDDNNNEELKNKSITRFLKPESGYDNESSAYIYINTSKTLGAGDVNANLAFDNFTEIVGYRAETGRVTTLQSSASKSKVSANKGVTIGDIIPENIPENDLYHPDHSDPTREPDIDMAETVTLSPPTGRYKLRYYIKTHKGLIRITQTTLMAMIMLPIAYLSIKKIKTRKKFYK